MTTVTAFVLPRIPASAGALIFDGRGRLLIVNPTYKEHWTIPGGIMEADGETPWEACRREVREEVGLTVEHGRLVAVDFLRPKPAKPGGMRFLFDCGVLSDEVLDAITLQEEELSEYRLADRAGPRAPERPTAAPGRRGAGAGRRTSLCTWRTVGRSEAFAGRGAEPARTPGRAPAAPSGRRRPR